nr:MAG TPA: hypothetical protein [Caudoviricetes sp.]
MSILVSPFDFINLLVWLHIIFLLFMRRFYVSMFLWIYSFI